MSGLSRRRRRIGPVPLEWKSNGCSKPARLSFSVVITHRAEATVTEWSIQTVILPRDLSNDTPRTVRTFGFGRDFTFPPLSFSRISILVRSLFYRVGSASSLIRNPPIFEFRRWCMIAGKFYLHFWVESQSLRKPPMAVCFPGSSYVNELCERRTRQPVRGCDVTLSQF